MNLSFNIAEQGEGSYRLLAILRWVMVVIFVSFGMQKFTLQSAQGIVQFISNSPFVSWLSVFGLRGEAYVLGVTEFGIAVLLAAGAFSPILSAIGALMGVITFAVTWSFFFTTPGGGEMEPVDRPDGMEPGRRVPVQGHRAALRLPRAAAGVVAAVDRPVAKRIGAPCVQ
ncbi:putative membrane protein YphA (DoxX/SURF4 family) [Bradyrhizobium sp. JR6.1]